MDIQKIIIAAKCRKGKSAGRTKAGAYWLAAPVIPIHRSGGDGVGQSQPDRRWTLELRHYSGGQASLYVALREWHQGTGLVSRSWDIGDTHQTVASVESRLRLGVDGPHGDMTCYDGAYRRELVHGLKQVGMPE